MASFNRFDRAEREVGNFDDVFRSSERILLTSFCACPFSLDCLPSCSFLLMGDCVLPLVRAGARKASLGKG